MSKTGIFVMGLIGSILGILGALIVMVPSIFFFAGMIDFQQPVDAPLTDGAVFGGLLIAGFHATVVIALMVVALIKSTPGSLAKGVKNCGIWLLVIGIVSFFVNVFLVIPCILIVLSGSFALAYKEEDTQNNVIESQE